MDAEGRLVTDPAAPKPTKAEPGAIRGVDATHGW